MYDLKKAHHYVGLIGWSEFNFGDNDKVYCDSLVLLLAARVMGYKLNYLPGALSLKSLNLDEPRHYYLCPFELASFPKTKCYILPYQSDWEALGPDLKLQLDALYADSIVYIGISSPNQNKLAQIINENYGYSVHAVGAALLDHQDKSYSFVKFASGKGFDGWRAASYRLSAL